MNFKVHPSGYSSELVQELLENDPKVVQEVIDSVVHVAIDYPEVVHIIKFVCPFCNSWDTTWIEKETGHCVKCRNCGALGPPGTSVNDAYSNWDNRAVQPSVIIESKETK